MGYVVAGIIFMLVVGGGVTFLVMRATAGSTPATPEDGDSTPTGDTPQHADGDAERGGTGDPVAGPNAGGRGPSREPDEPSGGRYKRDPVGGEAEAEPTIDVGEAPKPGG